MRPPKLPGAEKFKFADRKACDVTDSSKESNVNVHNVNRFVRGTPSRSTCPPTPNISSDSNSSNVSPTRVLRSDSKRKPILPLSGRITSRVLTLTLPPINSDLRTCGRRDDESKRSNESLTSIPSITPPLTSTTSRVSLLSDSIGSQSSQSSQCSPLDRCGTPSQWSANSVHRLSSSSQSSWEDENNVWTITK